MAARLWLVDDDAELRRYFADAVERCSDGLRLTGSFGTSGAALAAADRGETVEIALIDLGLPDASGEALIRRLRRRWPAVPLLAFSARSDDAALFAALRAGAYGYLTKETPLDELLAAIGDALRGAAPLGSELSLRVVSRFWELPVASGDAAALTEREHEVLEVLCTGASYRETAESLGIAEGTVQTHVKRIYDKLGVTSKAEAVRVACEMGLGSRWRRA